MTSPLDRLLASVAEIPTTEETVKVASVSGTSAADELEQTLTKQSEVTTEMASPVQQGREIADRILGLLKSATDGTAPVSAENRVIAETTAVAGSSSAGVAETPRVGNTATQVLEALVANAYTNGAVDPLATYQDNVGAGNEGDRGPALTSKDGIPNGAYGEGGQAADLVHDEEVEKVAAVVALVDAGYDFEQAVGMVKAASDEIEAEGYEQVKIAAINSLMSKGFSVENAVELVKEAARIPSLDAFEKGMMRRAKKITKTEAAKPMNRASNFIGEKADQARNFIGEKADQAREQAYQARNFIGEKADQAREQAYQSFSVPRRAALNAPNLERDLEVADTEEGAKRLLGRGVAYGKHYAHAAGPAALAAGGAVGAGAVGLALHEKKAAVVEYLTANGVDLATALQMVG